MKEIEIVVKNYDRAVSKLIEGLNEAETELNRDGVIQRFEFTFELLWKSLRLILLHEGFECRSPRSCIKEAFKNGFVVDGEIYLDMLDDRNRTSHVYDEEISREIFLRIENLYAPALKKAQEKFQKYVKKGSF